MSHSPADPASSPGDFRRQLTAAIPAEFDPDGRSSPVTAPAERVGGRLEAALGAAAALLLVFAVYVAVLAGSIVLDKEQPRATVIAAILSLTGVFFTGGISLIGFLLKYVIDSHSTRLQEIAEKRLDSEARHNRTLARQAEDRLRLDTAIRAVSLMSSSSGAPAPDSQKAGALFALTALNQKEFALSLLENMWPRKDIDSPSALWLINQGLLAEPRLQEIAVTILASNVDKLHTSSNGNFQWPESLTPGRPYWNHLSLYAREMVLDVMLRVLVALPRHEWSQGYLNAVLAWLYLVFSEEREERIRDGSGLALYTLLKRENARAVFFASFGHLHVSELRRRIEEVVGVDGDGNLRQDRVSDSVVSHLERLEEWAQAPSGPGVNVGPASIFPTPSKGKSPRSLNRLVRRKKSSPR